MVLTTLSERLRLDDSLVRKIGFNPYYPEIQSALDDPLVINGKNYIDLASNNYLGMANNPKVKEAVKSGIDKYGISMCATPIASGYTDLYKRVETKLSDFVGLEKTLIYPSCYQANNGLFNAIIRKDDVVMIDRFAHSSLVEGIKVTGCRVRPFLHNNLDHLEQQLKRINQQHQIFVVTESVFSTEGSIAPFDEITDLCMKYDAVPVIDDSHGIGVLGTSGRGILEYKNIVNYQGIYTASLGKALANLGGMISGPKKYLDYLKYYSSHLVYSTAILPSVLAGVEKVLEIITDEFHVLSRKMWDYCYRISDALKESGYELTSSITPITSIKAGSVENTLKIAKALFNNGILSTPFIYPSVQFNEGRVRLIAGANLKDESINRASDILKNLKSILQ